MNTDDLRDLDFIQFGLYSPEEILEQSVCEVSHLKLTGTNSVYDERMGVLEPGKRCETCHLDSKACVGHFGHISLNINILHPLFHKMALSILKCVCYKCSRVLLTSSQLELIGVFRFHRSARFHKIMERMDRVDYCAHCETIQPRYVFSSQDRFIYMVFKIDGESSRIQMSENEILKIFQNVLESDVRVLGFDPVHFQPKNLILTVLPVLPPVARPYIVADNITCDDDLTVQYLEIVKTNHHIGNLTVNDVKRQKCVHALKFKIKSLFDNSGDRQRVSNGRPLKGIKKRLTGKEGIIRNNLMGKRVDKSARTVIGPDPTLEIDEIAIPPEIADILSYSMKVNRHNLEAVRRMIEEGQANFLLRDDGNIRINLKYATTRQGTRLHFGDVLLKKNGKWVMIQSERDLFLLEEGDKLFRNGEAVVNIQHNTRRPVEIRIGDVVERKLRDGDVLLLNRQPTLHRGSMIAQRVRIRPGKTIRLNLAITSSFNADFDGDEMNLHCPASVETEAELRELSSVHQNLISNQSSKANIIIVQDALLGAFLMTRKTQSRLTRSDFFQIATVLPESRLRHLSHKMKIYRQFLKLPDDHYDGRMLFSLILPNNFFYRNMNQADSDEPEVIIRQGILLHGAIKKTNLGANHRSLVTVLFQEYGEEVCGGFLNDVQFLANRYLLKVGFSIGVSDCVVTKKDEIQTTISRSFMKAKSIEEHTRDERIREVYVLYALSGARDTGMAIAKNALRPENRFLSTVVSGAKGDYFNIAQITGLLGQQNLNGKRIMPQISNNRRTLPHYPIQAEHYTDDMKYESAGFIRSSFVQGLSPREFFFHAMTGREGITDTAMKSVVWETTIVLMVNGRVMHTEIGRWVDGLLEDRSHAVHQYSEKNMELLHLTDDDQVLIPTTDEKGNITWERVVAATRHDPGDHLFRVRTQSGREVVATDSKSLILWDHQIEEYVEKPTAEARVGDCLPLGVNVVPPPMVSAVLSVDDLGEELTPILSDPRLWVADLPTIRRVLERFETNHRVFDGVYRAEGAALREALSFLYSRLGLFTDLSVEKEIRVAPPKDSLRQRDTLLDPIVSIERIDGKTHPKVYDLTIPSTLNFGLANGLQVRDTATSGYIQRRMIKIAEDIQIKYDGTVRNSVNNIIQMAYGDNFMDPVHTTFLGEKGVACDVGRLVERVNFDLSQS